MQKLLRAADLISMKIVGSRMTLKRAIDSEGFPPGRLATPNSRVWTEDEVLGWLESRPVAKKPDYGAGHHTRTPVTGDA